MLALRGMIGLSNIAHFPEKLTKQFCLAACGETLAPETSA
jgi:hypothetical protein